MIRQWRVLRALMWGDVLHDNTLYVMGKPCISIMRQMEAISWHHKGRNSLSSVCANCPFAVIWHTRHYSSGDNRLALPSHIWARFGCKETLLSEIVHGWNLSVSLSLSYICDAPHIQENWCQRAKRWCPGPLQESKNEYVAQVFAKCLPGSSRQ